jgi:hypothetical protein
MARQIVLENEAVIVTRIDDASIGGGSSPIGHSHGLLVGVRDGSGWLLAQSDGEARYLPLARGRVDWLGTGELRALAASPPFGEAFLVELRSLPDAPGVERTFGDKLLVRNELVCVYEEIVGPTQERPMHSHAPRLILLLTDAHVQQWFPSGETREDRIPAGRVLWAPGIVVHVIRNVGDSPYWTICLEHP